MPRVVHFDISADEPERAIRFYTTVFGWKVEKWNGPFDYWLFKTGDSNEPGIDGGLGKREDPAVATTNIIDVPSADKFASKITANGGKIVQPKQAIAGIGYLIACQDTEGNTFSIMEADESAE